VVLCKPSDYDVVPPKETFAFYKNLFTPGTGGIADYFHDQSGGHVDLSGTVVTDWTTTTDTSFVNPQDNGRRDLDPTLTGDEQVSHCVNTQSGLPNFGSFYNYIAVWNVIVGVGGGIPTNIAGRTVPAVKMNVGANMVYFAHEMGHGYTLGHSYNDTFNNCGGGPGEYCDPYDIMSALNVYNYSGNVCFQPPDFHGNYVSDCSAGPGMNLWNKINLGWSTSVAGNGFAGTGAFATTPWPQNFDQSIPIAPRNHPEMNNWRGIYVPAHKEYGYTVEFVTADGWEQGILNAPVLLVHRVFNNNATPYLVTETGGVQTDFTHPFTESNEGSLSIALTGISGSPPVATVHVKYSPGPAIWWNENYGYDLNNPPGIGDWAPGDYKGQCALGQGITSVSRAVNGVQSHALQCGPRTIAHDPTGGSCNVRNVFYGNRGDTDNGWDWDVGSYKAECAANEYVAGISQAANGVLNSILCCPGSVSHNSCDAQVFYNNSSPAFQGFDWDVGYYKGQCPSGQYVAGISTPAFTSVGTPGAAHAVLCCSP
jgi:hypothetical protein